MEGAFAWLGAVMEWLGNLIPRILIVRSTHAGVKFVGGKRVVRLDPGVHVYWPAVTEVSVIPVARQTFNLVTQVLLTSDKQKVCISVVLIYKITNIVDALSNNWDINDTISDVTQMAVVKVVTEWTLDDLIRNITGRVERRLSVIARAKLKTYGVTVIRCGITDFTTCEVIKVVGDAGAMTVPLKGAIQ